MRLIMRLIEKVFALAVVVPPLYMSYRFIKWYLKQKPPVEEVKS